MKNLKALILLLTSTFALGGCFDGGSSQGEGSGGGKSKTSYTLGETFRFDHLDLTFKSDFVYGQVDNDWSDNYGKKTFGVPVAMTNHKNEPHSLNFMYYDCYGPNGSKESNVSAYFDEATSMDWGGDIMSGSTATRYLYFTYSGEGQYCVYLDNFSTSVNVKFEVHYGN